MAPALMKLSVKSSWLIVLLFWVRSWTVVYSVTRAELAYQSLRKSLQHVLSYNHLCAVVCCLCNFQPEKCSMLRRNKFVRARMDFWYAYAGDWTGLFSSESFGQGDQISRTEIPMTVQSYLLISERSIFLNSQYVCRETCEVCLSTRPKGVTSNSAIS